MKLLLFSTILILIVNCQVDPNFKKLGSTDYRNAIQLQVGNEWVYEVTETRDNGNIVEYKNEVIQILDTINFNGRKGFVMASNQQYFFERIVVDSMGYVKDYYNNTIIFANVSSDSMLFEDDNMYIIMTDIDSTISVPAGTFKTINYKRVFKSNDSSSSHFYANGIGLVKQVYKGPGVTKEHNLIDYQIK